MTLASRVEKALSRDVDPAVSEFAARIAKAAGACALLFYGSNLRTASLEGVLDFYVLLDGESERGMWPRVSYQEWERDGQILRVKIATMTLAKFAAAAAGESRDTTIWARFVQPSALVWSRNDRARQSVKRAIMSACQTAAKLAIAVGPKEGEEDDFWRALFQATYKAELRVEKPGREDSILSLNREHFVGLLPDSLDAQAIDYNQTGNRLRPELEEEGRKQILNWWRLRRRLGKPINVARLLRASRTFEGAGRYAAWKVERHTGVKVPLTPWRERHPVISAPTVLWKVWRARRLAR